MNYTPVEVRLMADSRVKRARRTRKAINLALRGLAAVAGVGIMWFEGQHQAGPGVGFVVGMTMIGLALIPWRSL